jgi:hypothetical protein
MTQETDPLETQSWDWEEIHVAISRRRRWLGLSRFFVAGRLDMPQSTYRDWELGDNPMKMERFSAICDVLRMVADIKVIDRVVTVKLTERRKQHAVGRNVQSPGRCPEDETEDDSTSAS